MPGQSTKIEGVSGISMEKARHFGHSNFAAFSRRKAAKNLDSLKVPVLNYQEFVAADGDQLFTTSNQIAQVFGKRPADGCGGTVHLLHVLPHFCNGRRRAP